MKTLLGWLKFPVLWLHCVIQGGHIWAYGPDGQECQDCGRRKGNWLDGDRHEDGW